ncbi:MAG: 16S rRNA (cytidine(1402)-2'-O)-methyltransferase [Bradymonadales bacterium]|nr:MAG: 16S rRNA (cytidine(1402)-2'-O)-methyltransferase [Bradymonadales bacterium]
MSSKLKESKREAARFFVVGSPIGNLEDISFRAVRILSEVDRIFCEDTRRSLKLLNHLKISKPLESCPYFKEEEKATRLLECLRKGESVAFLSDAGMPGFSDPGNRLVRHCREQGFGVEVIGGVSALTSFLAGLTFELTEFHFYGFLPPKSSGRKKFWTSESLILPCVFLESTHRLESSLELIAELRPDLELCLAKELSKVSEAFFQGSAKELLDTIPSWKGEWIGLARRGSP